MPKSNNEWQRDARAMAERIERDRATRGMQLALLPDEGDQIEAGTDPERKAGRPKGAKNKISSQMRDYLAAKGLRMPEDVLTEIAGLTTRDDAITLAMRQAERVLSWAYDGAHIGKKGSPKATAAQRLEAFRAQYTMILRATEALMPFMAPKATPDVVQQQVVQVNVPAAPAAPAPGVDARVISGQSSRRMMPADVAHNMQRNQTVTETETAKSDNESRTK